LVRFTQGGASLALGYYLSPRWGSQFASLIEKVPTNIIKREGDIEMVRGSRLTTRPLLDDAERQRRQAAALQTLARVRNSRVGPDARSVAVS
jgi:hypothetical protein